jgi:hypothetical protein
MNIRVVDVTKRDFYENYNIYHYQYHITLTTGKFYISKVVFSSFCLNFLLLIINQTSKIYFLNCFSETFYTGWPTTASPAEMC